MNNPYATLLMDMFAINDRLYTQTVEQVLTLEVTAIVDQAIEELPTQNDGGRMILIVERYYGIRRDMATLAQIGKDLLKPVTGSRVRDIKEKSLRLLRSNPTLQPVAAMLKEAGIETDWIETTSSLPTLVLINSLKDLVDSNQQFGGTFLLDHFPECTLENPCPTCQAKKPLVEEGLFAEMQRLAKEWQQGPSSDWKSIPVQTLRFSIRVSNALKNENIVTLGDLVQKKPYELLRAPYIGRKSLREIREKLATLGLKLAE